MWLSLCEPKVSSKATEPILLTFSQNLYTMPEYKVYTKICLKMFKNRPRFGLTSQIFSYNFLLVCKTAQTFSEMRKPGNAVTAFMNKSFV